jgi:hypothetical protein
MIIENIQSAYSFFVNKNNSLTKKGIVLISVVSILFIIEVVFKFSYNIHVNNKLTQLEIISNIKKGYNVNSLELDYLNEQKEEVLNRRHYFYHIKTFYHSLSDNIKKITYPTNSEIKIKPKLSIFYTVLSGSYLFLIAWLVFIISPIVSNNRVFSNIYDLIAATFTLALFTVIFTSLFMLLPVLYKPIINYILYFIIHTSLFIYIGKKTK